MQNIKIDWKWVFHTKTHHCVFININDRSFTSFWKEYANEINDIEKFIVLIPFFGLNLNPSDIAKKYGVMLKDFFNSNKTTLIVEEKILNILIKEEKKPSFFKYLMKRNKNVIVFYENEDFLEHVSFANDNKSINILQLDEEKLIQLMNSKDYFEIIKTSMKSLYSPFKNPMESFKKIQSEN